MYPVPQPVVSPWACTLPSQRYPIPFVSPSLDWLAWLGLASLASAWLVSSAAATTTATTPEQASTTTAAAQCAAAVVFYACSGVVAAADETSHAEPSQASQSREGLTNGIAKFCDGKGQAKGLTTGCGTGYIQFVSGPVHRPTWGRDSAHDWVECH